MSANDKAAATYHPATPEEAERFRASVESNTLHERYHQGEALTGPEHLTIAAAHLPGVPVEALDRFYSSWLCSDGPATIAYLPTKERPLPPMTVQQLAGLLHQAQGTLGDVAYYPDGCHTCDVARTIHAELIGDLT